MAFNCFVDMASLELLAETGFLRPSTVLVEFWHLPVPKMNSPGQAQPSPSWRSEVFVRLGRVNKVSPRTGHNMGQQSEDEAFVLQLGCAARLC